MKQKHVAQGVTDPARPHKLTLTVEEAAATLGIGRNLAYELASTGGLPVLRLGRRMVVPLARLEALLAGSPGEPGQD